MIFMDKTNPHMVRVNLQNIIYHLKRCYDGLAGVVPWLRSNCFVIPLTTFV